MNTRIAPFDNLKARQAVNYAIDRKALVPALIAATNVYRGLALPRGVPDAWLSAATLGGSTGVLLALVPLADPHALAAPSASGLTWLGAQTAALVAGYLCYFGLQRRAELAPGGHGLEHGQILGLRLARTQAAPRLLGIDIVGGRVGDG